MSDPLPPDTVPDDAAKLARAKVDELRLKALTHPNDEYYALCLRGWLRELAKATQDAESGTVQSPVKHTEREQR